MGGRIGGVVAEFDVSQVVYSWQAPYQEWVVECSDDFKSRSIAFYDCVGEVVEVYVELVHVLEA